MKHGTLRTILGLVAALALTTGLAACGGSDDNGGGSTQSATAQPGKGKPAVTLGTKNFTEQFVLGQLYKQALEAKGFKVALKQNIGSTEIADKALRSGQIDMYPEYIGIFNTAVAGDAKAYPSVEAAFAAGARYARAHGYTLLPLTPFTDVDALAVLPAYASQHNLRSVADLASIRGLRLGAPPEFRQRETGLVGLARVYGIRDVDFSPLTIGLQYQALDDGKIDTADVFTTDGQLQGGRYVVLDDPKNVFGFQNVTPIVSTRVLAAEGTAFEDTLNAVSRVLTTRAMQQMNAAVAIDKQSPADVAKQFLQANGLV
ncbi:MAG TPA: glycine betaine ABC transporter substrate-binding protein [Conexibacter sp.]|nr:glycine betaine ABC transporter substrate-binding protein [Conexibacter sp.]